MPNHRAPVRVRVATVLVAVTLGLSGCANPFSGEVTPAAQVGTQASTPTVDGDPGDAQLTVAADADPDGVAPGPADRGQRDHRHDQRGHRDLDRRPGRGRGAQRRPAALADLGHPAARRRRTPCARR